MWSSNGYIILLKVEKIWNRMIEWNALTSNQGKPSSNFDYTTHML